MQKFPEISPEEKEPIDSEILVLLEGLKAKRLAMDRLAFYAASMLSQESEGATSPFLRRTHFACGGAEPKKIAWRYLGLLYERNLLSVPAALLLKSLLPEAGFDAYIKGIDERIDQESIWAPIEEWGKSSHGEVFEAAESFPKKSSWTWAELAVLKKALRKPGLSPNRTVSLAEALEGMDAKSIPERFAFEDVPTPVSCFLKAQKNGTPLPQTKGSVFEIAVDLLWCLTWAKEAGDDRREFEAEGAELQELAALAEGGDDVAGAELARRYILGIGVDRDREEAARWAKPCAERGNPLGTLLLAELLLMDPSCATEGFEKAQKQFELARENERFRDRAMEGLASISLLGGHEDEAFQAFADLANKGLAESQSMAGSILFSKSREAKKPVGNDARLWLKLAAGQGNADAAEVLGAICYNAKKTKDAERWLAIGSAWGNAAATQVLANIYQNEDVGEFLSLQAQDQEAFVSGYLTSMNLRSQARAGDAQSQLGLADLHCTGHGVRQSYEEARKWAKLSAEQGTLKAMVLLGTLSHSVGKDEAEALRWCKAAAELGSAEGQYWTGYILYYAKSPLQNKDEAISWLKKSATQGYPESHLMLGIICINDSKQEEAVPWLEFASKQDNVEAHLLLAGLYLEGKGVKQNDDEAVRLLELASKHGSAEAASLLFYFYQSHMQRPGAYENLAKWSQIASMRGDADASFFLANLLGQKGDNREAVRWLEVAASQGHEEAARILGGVQGK